MGKVRFELNRSGVRELLLSDEMGDAVSAYGQKILDSAGEGYEKDLYRGRNRVNSMVWPETIHAKNSNMKHNTLLKAMGAAKG